MAVPTLITDLSTTAASNSPAGSDSPVDTDNFIRALSAFIAQNYANKAAKAGPTFTGTLTLETLSASGASHSLTGTGGVTLNFSGTSSTDNQINSYSSANLEIVTRHATAGIKLYVANARLAVTWGATGKMTIPAPASGYAFNFPTATPASAGASGAAGDISWDASYIYVCTATNTWKRAAIATW